MAVEIIFQCGDKKYWDEHWKNKNYMSEVFDKKFQCENIEKGEEHF